MTSSRTPLVETAGPPGRSLLSRNVRTAPLVSPTCGDWLAVFHSRLTEPLFHPAAVERLLTIAHSLPGDCLGILETRLASGAGPVDVSVRLLEPDQARCMAERVSPPHLRSFLTRWSEPGGPFSSVRSVWLEFDLDRTPEGLPEPVVCAKLAADADPHWVVGLLLPSLLGRPLAGGQRDLWVRCQREIPVPGRLLYAFSLHARGGGAVRMEIFGLEPGQILGYLGRVAPAAVPVATEITPLFEGVERLHLSLDLSPEGILPRIGIEGSFPRLPRREPRWASLFDHLEERGLCHSAKRDAALAWPGYDTFWTAPKRWPVGAVGVRGFCVRALSHVKVVCQAGRDPEAKAYFVFCYAGAFKGLQE
jgi:hypothetical protein